MPPQCESMRVPFPAGSIFLGAGQSAFLPRSGQGPTPQAREAGCFEIMLVGTSDAKTPLSIRGRVRGESDPGYGETSKMLAESALCLAFDELAPRAGILTPAVCMADALLARLRAAGMTFEVE